MKRFVPALVAFSVAGLLPLLSLAKPKPEEGWGLPHDASLEGWRIDWLLNITTVFLAILFLIMCVWMGLAAIKHGKNHKALYDLGTGKKQVLTALTISAAIFFVVDGNLFVNALLDLHGAYWDFERAEKDRDAVRIEINAHQWAWDLRYAGPDGRFNTRDDIVTLNEMVVPVDSPIIIQQASPDVMHSMFIPNMRYKLDAIPGTIMRAWFQATETGEFDIACVQQCGQAHYQMGGILRVLSRSDYRKWAAEASAKSELAYDPEDVDAHWGWPWKAQLRPE